jgi:hypothetical protein
MFLIIDSQYLQPLRTPLTGDGHGLGSMNVGYQNAHCGKTSHIVHVFSTTTDLDTPTNKLAFQDESQRAAFCLKSNFIILNETSLSYIYAGIFKVFPSITLNGIDILFNFFKVSTIALFAFILFRFGLSPIYVMFISIFSHFLIYNVDQTHRFGMYSFFISNYLFFLSISILYLYGLKKYLYKFIPLGILIGSYAAFLCNFRTSHSIIVMYVLFVLLIFIYFFMKEILDSKVKRFIFIVLSFSALYSGFQLYNYTFIKPLHEAAKNQSINNYTYHAVAHPLVLSLGISPSDLTAREGITWNDSIGASLAQKIDPSVSYLSKDYEKALFSYYAKLWIYFPREMFDIYKNKFYSFTTLKIRPIVQNLKRTNLNGKILDILGWLQSGVNSSWNILIIFLLSLSLLGIFYRKFSFVGLFFSFSILGSCFLLLCESLIIMHSFVLTYHSLVNFLFSMIFLYYVQIAVNFLYNTFLNYKKQNEVEYAR